MKNQKTFKIYNLDQPNDNEYCEITIQVDENLYDNKETYYDISYAYQYSDNNRTTVIKTNPFMLMDNHRINKQELFNEHSEGEIIVKNSFTEKLIEYLLMDYDSLGKYSGNTTPEEYKLQIMETITLFWD